MIVRDEERNLEACLAPVANLVDEIVIVDTGSCDATKEIALRFTPHVYDFPWCDDFSAARNESLRHATGEWILWLDADDRIRPEQLDRLRDLLANLDEQPRAIMMEILIPPSGPSDEPHLLSHVRLFRRHPALHWRGRVHEQFVPSFAELGYEQVLTDVQIEHVGYLDRAENERKLRRKLRLLRMDYAVDPENPSTLLHLASTHWGMKSAREARTHLLQLLSLATGEANYLRWAYEALTQMSLADGKPREALQWAIRGLEAFPNGEYLLFLRATAHYVLDEFVPAARILQSLIHGQPKRQVLFASPANIRSRLAPRLLGTIRRFQAVHAEAEALFNDVLSQFPSDCTTWYDLGLLYLDRRDEVGLRFVATQLLGLPGGNTKAGLLVALCPLRHGDLKLAGRLIDDLVAASPYLTRPRMLRAEWLSKMDAPLDDQIQALRDILRIEPGNLETQNWLRLAMQAKQASAPATVANPFVLPVPAAGAMAS
jgi:tetratricopeptide (TPR) repeat protein